MRGRTGLILMLAFNVFVLTKAYQVTDDACTFECNTDTYQCKAVGQTQFWGFNCNDRDCREACDRASSFGGCDPNGFLGFLCQHVGGNSNPQGGGAGGSGSGGWPSGGSGSNSKPSGGSRPGGWPSGGSGSNTRPSGGSGSGGWPSGGSSSNSRPSGGSSSSSGGSKSDTNCRYECQSNGGCKVTYIGPSRPGKLSGSCFPASFGGSCSGTPQECQDCNKALNC